MVRSFSSQLAGQIGESLVVAELGRRGIIATAFAGNVPDIDLLAYLNGRSLPLQVKSWRTGSVSVNATRFLEIKNEAGMQSVTGIVATLDPNLIYVFVKIGKKLGKDRFFILKQDDLARCICKEYQAFLTKHGRKRPRNEDTTHHSVTEAHLLSYEDNWPLILAEFS